MPFSGYLVYGRPLQSVARRYRGRARLQPRFDSRLHGRTLWRAAACRALGPYILISRSDLDAPTDFSRITAGLRFWSGGCCRSSALLSRCPPASPACRSSNFRSIHLSARGRGVLRWLMSATSSAKVEHRSPSARHHRRFDWLVLAFVGLALPGTFGDISAAPGIERRTRSRQRPYRRRPLAVISVLKPRTCPVILAATAGNPHHRVIEGPLVTVAPPAVKMPRLPRSSATSPRGFRCSGPLFSGSDKSVRRADRVRPRHGASAADRDQKAGAVSIGSSSGRMEIPPRHGSGWRPDHAPRRHVR